MIMKYISLILAFLQMATFTVFTNDKVQTVGVNKYETHQTFETFGTSSCWWSQTIADEETAREIARLLYDDETGLGLDVYRYNIGGGEKDNPDSHGTKVTAEFYKNHLDFTPLGDVVSTITTLIQGSPDREWKFEHTLESGKVELDTKELREILGDVPLDNYEVIKWIEGYLKEGYESV